MLMLCPQCDEVRFPSGKDNVTPHVSSDKSCHMMPSYADRKRCAAAQCNGLGAMELQCTICDLKFHGACVGICNEVVSVLVPIAAKIGWVCGTCRDAAKSSIRKLLQTELTRLHMACQSDRFTLELASMKTYISRIQMDIDTARAPPSNNAPPLWPSLQASRNGKVTPEEAVLAAMHTELSDKQRRACNVIVRGLQLVDGVLDADLFTSLCEVNFPVIAASGNSILERSNHC